MTHYTGSLITTIANGQCLVLGLMAIRFWKKNRPAVMLSTVVSFLLCACAAVVIPTDEQMRVARFLGPAVLLLGMIWTSSTRHEEASVLSGQLVHCQRACPKRTAYGSKETIRAAASVCGIVPTPRNGLVLHG